MVRYGEKYVAKWLNIFLPKGGVSKTYMTISIYQLNYWIIKNSERLYLGVTDKQYMKPIQQILQCPGHLVPYIYDN